MSSANETRRVSSQGWLRDMNARGSCCWTAALCSFVLLTGCGTSQLIKEETGQFVEAGNKVIGEASAFFGSVVQSDHDFYATVIATSPSCPVPDLLADTAAGQFPPTNLYGPEGIVALYNSAKMDFPGEGACADYRAQLSALRDPAAKLSETWLQLEERYRERNAPLCMPRAEIACIAKLPLEQQRLGVLQISPTPLGIENFKVELDALRGISEYLEALGKLAQKPNARVDDTLKNAVEKLEQVQGYVDATWVTEEIKQKQDVVGGLLSTVREIYVSSKNAKQIGNELLSHGERIAEQLEQLASLSDDTYQQLYLLSLNSRVTRLKNYLEMQNEEQTLSDRQIAMTQYRKDALILRAAERLKTNRAGFDSYESPTGTALRGAIEAQSELIELANTENLTAEERARSASLSLRTFRHVLKNIYGALGAFGVL